MAVHGRKSNAQHLHNAPRRHCGEECGWKITKTSSSCVAGATTEAFELEEGDCTGTDGSKNDASTSSTGVIAVVIVGVLCLIGSVVIAVVLLSKRPRGQDQSPRTPPTHAPPITHPQPPPLTLPSSLPPHAQLLSSPRQCIQQRSTPDRRAQRDACTMRCVQSCHLWQRCPHLGAREPVVRVDH